MGEEECDDLVLANGWLTDILLTRKGFSSVTPDHGELEENWTICKKKKKTNLLETFKHEN